VGENSAVRIENNEIRDNNGNGIIVLRNSHARIRGNTIDGNDANGILVQENAGVNLRANDGNNGDFGLRCAVGAYASQDAGPGGFGSLTGTSGQTTFGTADDDGTCINNL